MAGKSWVCITIQVVVGVSLLLAVVGPQVAQAFDPEFSDFGDISFYKRDYAETPLFKHGYRPIQYRCLTLSPCKNGGIGPRRSRGGTCVCLCPAKWMGPACSVPVDDVTEQEEHAQPEAKEKRKYPWLLGAKPKNFEE